MKNRKITIIFLIILIAILIGGFFIIKNLKSNQETPDVSQMEEYTPEEEISEDQAKQTIVTLYFLNKETKELMPEARLIDIKEMVNAPYDTLINLLIAGPKNDKAQVIFPENTKLLKSSLEADILTLDFSAEFLNYDKSNENIKVNLIDSIVDTLTQLTEVNKVKILVDGNSSTEFSETYSI